MSLRDSWKRIRAWHKANTPPETFEPAPGASNEELTQLESLIGMKLPREFQESYRIHNGTSGSWLLYFGMLRSLAGIAKEWSTYSQWQKSNGYGLGSDWQPVQLEDPEKIKSIWWNPRRIPISDNGGGDPVTLDLDPANAGTIGQIIRLNHEVGPINVIARGFAEWIEQIACDLEAGKFVYDEDNLMVHPIDWDD